MRFGKAKNADGSKIMRQILGVGKFAFPLPVRLESGEYLWCEDYYEYRDGYRDSDGKHRLYYRIVPGYGISPTVEFPDPRRYAERDESYIKIHPHGPEDLIPNSVTSKVVNEKKSNSPEVERLKQTLSGTYFPPDK